MRFVETPLPGAFVIEAEPRHDERGLFARTFCGREFAERKIKTLLEVYPSQGGRPWFDAETLRGLMRLRGVECREAFAEAFHARKLRIGL